MDLVVLEEEVLVVGGLVEVELVEVEMEVE